MPGNAPQKEIGVVLDNGAGSIKVGKIRIAAKEVQIPDPFVASNALARPGGNATTGNIGTSRRPTGMLVGAEIDAAPDFSNMAFRRAHDRGYVARWDTERDIWSSVFSSDMGIGLTDLADVSLLVTEPVATPSHMRCAMDELVFETFGFGEYAASSPARLAAASPLLRKESENSHECRTVLVLDSGFSFTHAVPIVQGVELRPSIRRLNLGGKALTNHLKELVSFRSWNMMDETAVVNAIKERMCFISQDFPADLRASRDKKKSSLRREYILPDLSRGGVDPLGHVRSPDEELDGTEQILVMNNERISVPELLFYPSEVGLEQAGVAELIFQAVEASPLEHRPGLYANIVLTGGNCRFPGFRERILIELRPLVSDTYNISLYIDDDPLCTVYRGGMRALLNVGTVPLDFVSKAEYEEHGSRSTFARLSAAAASDG
jgi:actin-related protein 6